MLAKITAVLFLIISIVSIVLWLEYEQALTDPVISGKSKLIEIKKGDSFNKITDKLIQQNIAIKPLWFKLIAYQKKVSNKLKTGEYELQAGLTMPDILSKLVEGKSLQYSITFPEGWSFKQIFKESTNGYKK